MEEIRKILLRRSRKIIVDGYAKLAAVLIPIFKKRGDYYVILTKRTGYVEHHKWQISFPGGTYDDRDSSLEVTALRESEEEIGLNPKDVRILGVLDDVKTFTSNYTITPFIASIPYPYNFKKNDKEVEEIIELPIAAVFDEGNRSNSFVYGGHVIWGVTAKILKQLVDILRMQGLISRHAFKE
ncbi:MAG: NUDIX hydrolase [Candidatus Methanospirareceae archaeon]